MPCWIASSGTTVASFSVLISSRVETDWPGHSAWSLLSNTAFRRMVPLVVSTWLLISASVPVGQPFLPSVDSAITFGGEAASAALMSGSCSSGAVKITAIGSIWAMVTMPVWVDGVDDVADIDLAQAGDARDRRLHGGVVELGLRVGDRGVVGGDLRGQLRDGGALGVGLLPGGEFAELGVALQVEIGVGEIGFVLRLLGLGLVERSLERPRIDLDQRVAFLDELAFLEGDLVDLAVDAGAHQHGIEALHGAEAGQIDREIGLLDRGDLDGNRLCGRRFLGGLGCAAFRAVEVLPAEIAGGGDGGDQQNPTDGARLGHAGSWVSERQVMGASKRFPRARYNMRALYV